MIRALGLLAALGTLAAHALPARGAEACDDSCLIALADSTVAAVAAGDFRRVPWANTVRFTENNVPLMIGDAWWGSAGSTVGPRALALADTTTGNVVWIGTIWDHDAPAFGVIRLNAADGRVAELELVAARTPWPVPFGDPRAFALSRSMLVPVAQADRRSRARLIDIADAYLSTKQRNNGALLASFAPDCAMLENGVRITSAEAAIEPKAADCASVFRAGLFAPVERVRDRRYPVVDTQRGLVLAISVQDLPSRSTTLVTTDGRRVDLKRPYPMSRLVAEVVRIEGDQVVRAEGVAASLPYRMPTPWATARHP